MDYIIRSHVGLKTESSQDGFDIDLASCRFELNSQRTAGKMLQLFFSSNL